MSVLGLCLQEVAHGYREHESCSPPNARLRVQNAPTISSRNLRQSTGSIRDSSYSLSFYPSAFRKSSAAVNLICALRSATFMLSAQKHIPFRALRISRHVTQQILNFALHVKTSRLIVTLRNSVTVIANCPPSKTLLS